MYFNPENKGFSEKPLHASSRNITADHYYKLLQGQTDGMEIASDDEGYPVLVQRVLVHSDQQERLWRNKELCRADVELYKVQDSDPKAISTVSQWREYRKALRVWPDQDDFPNKEFRPKAPDAE